MAKSFFGRNNEEEDVDPGKAVETKFGEVNTKIEELGKNSVTKEEFKAVQEGVSFITDRLKAADKEKETREKAARDKAAKEQKPYDAEEAFNEFAADPAKAFTNATASANLRSAIALSKITRAEVLGGKEYYHGEFKAKVDNLIDTGHNNNLDTLTNPSYILNCYKLIMAEYVENGKLDEMKTAAAAHFAGGGVSGKSADEKDAKPSVQYRDQNHFPAGKAKYAAEQLGVTDADLVDAAGKGVINGLEVVA